MWWIIGIASLIIGIVLMCIDDWEWEDFLNPLGIVIAVFGAGCIIWAFIWMFEKPKSEVKAEVLVADSTQVQVVPDSIYAIQYIITWKTDEEIKCGDIILKGKTEKGVGDTITINLK